MWNKMAIPLDPNLLILTMTLEIATNCFCAMSSGKIINIPAKRSTGHKLQDRQTLRIQPRTLHCDLNFGNNNPIFHKRLWLRMMYHQTRFGCKRINSSEDPVQNTVQFCLRKVQEFWKYHLDTWKHKDSESQYIPTHPKLHYKGYNSTINPMTTTVPKK